jgi:hypothetical protein
MVGMPLMQEQLAATWVVDMLRQDTANLEDKKKATPVGVAFSII